MSMKANRWLMIFNPSAQQLRLVGGGPSQNMGKPCREGSYTGSL